MADQRFVDSYTQGKTNNFRHIIVDTETGVNYLLATLGFSSSSGMTVLVDKDGKPIITPVDSSKK